MSDTLGNLQRLLQLGQLRLDRLQAQLAQQQRQAERIGRNIGRMGELAAGSGASAAARTPALAANCAAYKGHLLQLMASQQQDLQLAMADMAVSQQQLLAAQLRQQALDQVCSGERQRLAGVRARQEQKQGDELAGQRWWRRQQQEGGA